MSAKWPESGNVMERRSLDGLQVARQGLDVIRRCKNLESDRDIR